MTSNLQEKPSALKKEHPAPWKINFVDCFLFYWVIFALLDPDTDPGTPLNSDHNTAIFCFLGRIRLLIHVLKLYSNSESGKIMRVNVMQDETCSAFL